MLVSTGPRTNPQPGKKQLIPDLEAVFDLADKYQDKLIVLDTKPGGEGPRLSRQLIQLLRRHPRMTDRVVVSNPDPATLNILKSEFHKQPDFRDFQNFTLDKETLNRFRPTPCDLDPLCGSAQNRFASMGIPRHPLAGAGLGDAQKSIASAREQSDDSGSPHVGKQIIAWTLNEPEEMARIMQARPHAVITTDLGGAKNFRDRESLDTRVIGHRGGGDLQEFPENSLPAVEHGLREADGIEVDIISARDGLLLYHDVNPNSGLAALRNLGAEADHSWRPVFPDLNSSFRKPLTELTRAEIRANYGYARNLTRNALLNVALNAVGQLLRVPLLLG
jgi:glycerophosphoryl diester phosphodiesterase